MGPTASYEDIKAAVMDVVRQHFRPEFINRIDDTVVFHALGKEQIANIAAIQIGRLQERLRQLNMQLNLSPEALSHIAEIGFDPVYGARPLKRVIQQEVENPLAQALLKGEFKGGDTIEAQWHDGKIEFKV